MAIQSYPHEHIQLMIAWDGWDPTNAMYLYYSCKGVDGLPVHHTITARQQGVCYARNKCICFRAAVKPDYLMYLDADNIMVPNYVERMVGVISNLDNKTLVYCLQKMLVHDDAGDIVSTFFRGEPDHNRGRQAFMDQIYKGNWIDMGTIIYPYRTDILFDTTLTRMVDWDLILALALQYKFYYIDDVLSVYNRNVNPNGISNTAPFQSNYDAIVDKWKDAYNA